MTDPLDRGTAIRVSGMGPAGWHHSVSYDGYAHETACGQTYRVPEQVCDVEHDAHSVADRAEACPDCFGFASGTETVADGGQDELVAAINSLTEQVQVQNAILLELVALADGEGRPDESRSNRSLAKSAESNLIHLAEQIDMDGVERVVRDGGGDGA